MKNKNKNNNQQKFQRLLKKGFLNDGNDGRNPSKIDLIWGNRIYLFDDIWWNKKQNWLIQTKMNTFLQV